jgi:hypothetical protein
MPEALEAEAPPRRVIYGNGRETGTRWLARQEWAQPAAVCRERLQRWQSGPFAGSQSLEVEALQISTKAEVYLARGEQGRAVVKLHRNPAAFAREHFALTLLGAGEAAPCPRLLAADEEHCLLVMEHIPRLFRVDTPEGFRGLLEGLGRVHGVGRRERTLLLELFGQPGPEDYLATFHSSAAAVDASAYVAAMKLLAADQGPDYLPVALLDLKWGHARQREDGSLAFVDVETFSPGVPEAFDLLQALNMVSPGYLPDRQDWTAALGAYLAGRGEPWELAARAERYHEVIRLMAVSFGLQELVAA